MIISIFTVINLVAAVSIVVLVLLQRGKGADMGAAFGGGSSQFFISALCLAYMYTQKGAAPRSVIESTTSQAPLAESIREKDSTDLPAVPGSED